jgi:hypothetical protein
MTACDPKQTLVNWRSFYSGTKKMDSFKSLVVASLLTYSAWFLIPQIEWRWMSEDALVIASYAGFGASVDMADWMSWLFFALTILINGGLLFFGANWRILFVCYTLLNTLVLLPFLGMTIETGLSVALRDINSIILGGLIVIILMNKNTLKTGSAES